MAEAGAVTEMASPTLHRLGTWDQEDALVHDALRGRPETSDR